MIGTLGWQELLIILVIIALLFGASRVADMGAALGKGVREFRTSVRSDDDGTPSSTETTSTTPATNNSSTPETSDPLVEDIERLNALRDRGVLDEAQFEEAKAKILSQSR